jgi:hypothetical protein
VIFWANLNNYSKTIKVDIALGSSHAVRVHDFRLMISLITDGCAELMQVFVTEKISKGSFSHCHNVDEQSTKSYCPI